ncbi:hypothetical protein ACFX13_030532 [Malus domestica]
MKEACSRNRRDIETHINRADLYSNHHRGNPISPFFPPPQSTAGAAAAAYAAASFAPSFPSSSSLSP